MTRTAVSMRGPLVGLALLVLGAACAPTGDSVAQDPREQPAPATTPSFDGVPISYETAGAGQPALVFVHGWSCDRSYWSAQVGPFSEAFEVVTLDLAGHGASGLDREAWTIASYGADVAAVVDALNLERVILIGHSMGGDVIVSAARLLGDRVAGLIWVDDYSQLGRVRTPEEVAAVLAPFRVSFADSTYAFIRRGYFSAGADPELVERVARDMSSAPPDVAMASLESSITNDRVVPAELAKLGKPVISLNPADSEPDVESLERHGVEVMLVPGVGHFMMMEDPEAFNAVLLEAIRRIPE